MNPLNLVVLISSLCLALLNGGCSTLFDRFFYERDSIVILDINLFDQRNPSSKNNNSWSKDWLFRRERLMHINQEIQATRPSIILLTEGVRKPGSNLDDDLSILTTGEFSNFQHVRVSHDDAFFIDASYFSAMVYRYGWRTPRTSVIQPKIQSQNQLSVVGYNVRPQGSSQRLAIVSVSSRENPNPEISGNKSTSQKDRMRLIARLIDETIINLRGQFNLKCQPPALVTGTFPDTEDLSDLEPILDKHDLVDAHDSMCLRRDCLKIGNNYADKTYFQGRRRYMFYQSNLKLTLAGLALGESHPPSAYSASRFGLKELWPTFDPALLLRLHLPRCTQNQR